MKQKQTAVAQALAPSTPVAESKAVAVASPDARIAQFHEYGTIDARDEKAWLERIPLYAQALKGCDFQTWERIRVSYCDGAKEAGYTQPEALWARRVAAPLQTAYAIGKPKSPTSSATRPKSAEAQARADKRKAEADRIAKLSDAQIQAEIRDKKTDAATKSTLYGVLAARVKSAKKERAAKEREESSAARKACIEQLDLMNAEGLKLALAKLVDIAASHPRA